MIPLRASGLMASKYAPQHIIWTSGGVRQLGRWCSVRRVCDSALRAYSYLTPCHPAHLSAVALHLKCGTVFPGQAMASLRGIRRRRPKGCGRKDYPKVMRHPKHSTAKIASSKGKHAATTMVPCTHMHTHMHTCRRPHTRAVDLTSCVGLLHARFMKGRLLGRRRILTIACAPFPKSRLHTLGCTTLQRGPERHSGGTKAAGRTGEGKQRRGLRARERRATPRTPHHGPALQSHGVQCGRWCTENTRKSSNPASSDPLRMKVRMSSREKVQLVHRMG